MLGGVAYVATLAVLADGGREPQGWFFAALAMGVAVAAAWRATGPRKWAGWGAAIEIASLGAVATSSAVDACAGLGVLVAVAAACVAMARLPGDGDGGMVRGDPRSARGEVAALGVAWWAAAMATVGSDVHGLRVPAEAALACRWAAAAVSAAILTGVWLVPLWRRPLELEVVARARAAREMVILIAAAASVIAVVGPSRSDHVGRLALVLAAVVVVIVATHPDAVQVARVSRRVVAQIMLGGTVALLGATAVEARAGDPWAVALVTAGLTLGIGAMGKRLEGPLRPAGGAWLDAFAAASDVAGHRADPLDAILAVLVELRAPLGLGAPAAELWTFAPPRCTSVDAAGYLHERDAVMPPELLAIAAAEPEGTLRGEVLDALQVRRPDLRAVAAWLRDRRALAATVVACEDETEGLLVLPRGNRTEPVTLEELRGLKRVANRLATACRARATEARMLARLQEVAARADAGEQRAERLTHELRIDSGRHALAAERLARPAALGAYAASSRMALEAIERRAAISAPIAIVAPSGVDPVPYLARVHLGGARSSGPLVLVDGTHLREHAPARWTDPDLSPLALADHGLLVLLDGGALPLEVQRIVARACAEARVPWERPDRLDVQLALTGIETPAALVGAGRLDPLLAGRLGDALDAPIHLPRLRERPEDFRSLLMDRLAREGLRTRGRPLGVEPAAFAKLTEYTFPGEDAELSAVVSRLVAHCAGETVRRADVDAIFDAPLAAPPAPGPKPWPSDGSPGSPPGHAKSGGRGAKRRKDPISA